MMGGGGYLDEVMLLYELLMCKVQMHGANVLLSNRGSTQEQSDIYLYQVKYSKQMLLKVRFILTR